MLLCSDLQEGYNKEEYIGEIGFTTMAGISYYLWIFLDLVRLNELVDKYKLQAIK